MELKGVRVFIHTQANPHCLPLLFMGPATSFPHSPLSHQLHARPVLHDWELPGKPFWLLVERGNPVMTTTRRGSYNSDTSSFSCVRSFLCVQPTGWLPTDHVLTSHEHKFKYCQPFQSLLSYNMEKTLFATVKKKRQQT